MAAKLKAAGFDTYIVQMGNLYKVQVGAYSQKSNAENMMTKLKAAGYDAFITTKSALRLVLRKNLRLKSPRKSTTVLALTLAGLRGATVQTV